MGASRCESMKAILDEYDETLSNLAIGQGIDRIIRIGAVKQSLENLLEDDTRLGTGFGMKIGGLIQKADDYLEIYRQRNKNRQFGEICLAIFVILAYSIVIFDMTFTGLDIPYISSVASLLSFLMAVVILILQIQEKF